MQALKPNTYALEGQISYIEEEIEKHKIAYKCIWKEFNKGNRITIKVLSHLKSIINTLEAVLSSLQQLQKLERHGL